MRYFVRDDDYRIFVAMISTCECCSLILFSLCVRSWLCPENHCAMHKPYNNVFVVVIHILSMLFVYINVYWCLTRFPFQTMLMSFNNNATGATSRAGTVYPSRAPYFTPELCGVRVRKFVCLCVVFCPPLLFFLYFFFWPLQCLSFSFDPCNVCLFLLTLAMSVFFFWPLQCLSFSFDPCNVCLFLLALAMSVFFFWPLQCLSFSFGPCNVCLFLLALAMSVFFFWPLQCLSFSFGPCNVCLFLLTLAMSVFFFWPLQYLSFSFGPCNVCLFLLTLAMSVFFFWPLQCLSFSFDPCNVCLFLLALAMSVFFFWPLQCLSFFFGPCNVCFFSFGPCNICLFLLALSMSVFFFWPLQCLSFFELQFLITPWYLQSPSDIFWCYWNIAMLMKVKFTIRKVKSSPFSDRFIFNRPVL